MTLSDTAYRVADLERYVPEPTGSLRPTFERDRARIVHSAALRRLAAKTQVVGPASNDFIRNRLTHTLEVAQVGRDLAHSLGSSPDVVEAACLAHDLGHPPFGHNGEAALNEAARDVGGFEGNAQTLRLLTRLEAKTLDAEGRSAGLNLTRAVLDASTKYPWTLDGAAEAHGRYGDGVPRLVRKFGVYADDLPVFSWMRAPLATADELATRRTCVEAQIMDFADDVAYSVHDVEDGVVAGRIDLMAVAADPGLRESIWATVRDWYLPGLDSDELEAAYDRLRILDAWPRERYDGSRRSLAGLKNLTSSLINRFCLGVHQSVRDAGLPANLIRYAADVPVPQPIRAEIAVLKGIAAQLVMKADDRVAANERQRQLLLELVAAYLAAGEHMLEPTFRADFGAASSDEARLRVVIDQVASMTDPSAVEAHRLISGAV
jgi:dGTPase